MDLIARKTRATVRTHMTASESKLANTVSGGRARTRLSDDSVATDSNAQFVSSICMQNVWSIQNLI